MADYRDVAGHYRPVLQDVDKRNLTATFTVEDESGEEIAHTVHLKIALCDTCEGRGTYTNPSIDAHGLTRDDFDEDPDFAESYRSGCYDVPCSVCHGSRVEFVIDEDANPKEIVAAYLQREQDAWDAARETTREREMGY